MFYIQHYWCHIWTSFLCYLDYGIIDQFGYTAKPIRHIIFIYSILINYFMFYIFHCSDIINSPFMLYDISSLSYYQYCFTSFVNMRAPGEHVSLSHGIDSMKKYVFNVKLVRRWSQCFAHFSLLCIITREMSNQCNSLLTRSIVTYEVSK